MEPENLEGKISITLGHLPYPRPILIIKEGKARNLADILLDWNGKEVNITVKEVTSDSTSP